MEMEINPAQQYRNTMDSVHLIADLKAKAVLTAEEVRRMQANKDHVAIMLAKDYWTDEDLTPFTEALS